MEVMVREIHSFNIVIRACMKFVYSTLILISVTSALVAIHDDVFSLGLTVKLNVNTEFNLWSLYNSLGNLHVIVVLVVGGPSPQLQLRETPPVACWVRIRMINGDSRGIREYLLLDMKYSISIESPLLCSPSPPQPPQLGSEYFVCPCIIYFIAGVMLNWGVSSQLNAPSGDLYWITISLASRRPSGLIHLIWPLVVVLSSSSLDTRPPPPSPPVGIN